MSAEIPDLEVLDSSDVEEVGHVEENKQAPDRAPSKEEIDEWEICPTPEPLAFEICRRIHEVLGAFSPQRILEPSAGDGPFVKAARHFWPNAEIIAVEPRGVCREKLFDAGANQVYSEYLDPKQIEEIDPNLVIGNPPYSQAENHIRMILNFGSHLDLAFLLKLSFYESKERLDFWQKYPELWMAPIVPRPGFKLNKQGKKGTDSQAYGLFCWVAGVEDETVPIRRPHIVWEPPKSRRGRRKKKEETPAASLPPPDLEV
jgi:hypothetical protein